MSHRSRPCTLLRLHVLVCLLVVPTTASAVPLVYGVKPFQSNIATTTSLRATVDVEPDLAGEFPQNTILDGTSNTTPSPSSTATVDVGLPGNFQGGANGITFSDLVIDFNEILNLFSIGGINTPLGGGEIQPFAFTANLGSLSIVLDSPFMTTLTEVNPGEFAWASLADVTISGELSPSIVIPSVQTVELDPVPFAQSTSVLLAGTFSGDSSGTQVTVGIPVGELQNLAVPLPVIQETLDPLGLGEVSIDAFFSELTVVDLTAAIVYSNSTPIPEPGTAALLGIGLVGLALLRRR